MGPAVADDGAGAGVDTRITDGGRTSGATDASGATEGTGAPNPSCCRISSLTSAELSAPQFWQTKRMGELAISGVTSKEYFEPQGHWIFM